MNASGEIWQDAALVWFVIYTIMGAWLVTVAGVVVCVFIAVWQRRVVAALACLSLAPLPLGGLLLLRYLRWHGPSLTGLAESHAWVILNVLMVAAIVACPVVALRTAWRGRKRPMTTRL